uniref:WD repeat and SOCS box containing 1 n=1 Tax=Petromyzon marinus TaxID=7757 RepID=S4RP24_PETMA
MASFPHAVNEDAIAPSYLVSELRPPSGPPRGLKSGCEVRAVAWSPDGTFVAWAQGPRGTVRLLPWSPRLNNLSLSCVHGCHWPRPSGSGEVIADGDGAVVEGGDGNDVGGRTIECGETVWSLALGSPLPGKTSRCINIEFHRFRFDDDALVLATGLASGRIKIWDVFTGKFLLYLMDHTAIVQDLTFAPDGSLMLVSASRDKTLRVWDLKDDGNMVKVLKGHHKWVNASAFSLDASMLCSVGAGKSVLLWEMEHFTLLRRLEGHLNDVVACEFSPDGALLATASHDTRCILWDPYTGTAVASFGHLFPAPSPIFAGGANYHWVRAVAFSRDGLHVASLADDGLLRFWHVGDDSAPVAVANVPNGQCCAFSPNGHVLLAGRQDGGVGVWAAPRDVGPLQHLCRMSLRRVSTQQVDAMADTLPGKMHRYLTYRSS